MKYCEKCVFSKFFGYSRKPEKLHCLHNDVNVRDYLIYVTPKYSPLCWMERSSGNCGIDGQYYRMKI
jgi:hypothetical protein